MSSSALCTQVAPRTGDLVALANRINDLHDRATEAARKTIEHARECGELLNQAKDQIGHGGFVTWVEASCRVKLRQAQKYMRLAREWSAIEAKCASNAPLTIDGALRLLDSGETLTKQEAAEISAGDSLLQSAKQVISDCNWNVGEGASIWTARWANGRTDADFGDLIGMSGDKVCQRRRVWERWGEKRISYPNLSWSHFYAAVAWNDAEECLEWADKSGATVAEMKAWQARSAPAAGRRRPV